MAADESAPMTAEIPMTSAEAAAILGVSPRTVQRLSKSGELPCLGKLNGPNGDWLYAPADVHRLAAERAARKPAEGEAS